MHHDDDDDAILGLWVLARSFTSLSCLGLGDEFGQKIEYFAQKCEGIGGILPNKCTVLRKLAAE